MINKVHKESNKAGMDMNSSKTKILSVDNDSKQIKIGGPLWKM